MNRKELIQKQMEIGKQTRSKVISLRLSGKSLSDIAKKLNLSEATVRNILKDSISRKL